MPPQGYVLKGFRPVPHLGGYIHFHEIKFELSILILPEVENLVDEAHQDADVLHRQSHELMLPFGQVVRTGHLRYGFGNQCKRCPQIVGDIGEKR